MQVTRTLRGLLSFALLAALGCHEARGSVEAFPRNQTVYVGGFQWQQPSTFNPLASTPDWPVDARNSHNLFWEPLLVFNTLTGEMRPQLAESFQVFPDRIEVVLQARARFSDGTSVTPDDVKYTYELGRRYRSLRVAPVWPFLKEIRIGAAASPSAASPSAASPSAASPSVASPSAASPSAASPSAQAVDSAADRRVVFVMNPERRNPLVVLDMFQETLILPRHYVEPKFASVADDFNAFLRFKFDDNPVISGPYALHSYSAEKIATVRRDDYWGNDVFYGGRKAAPKYVVHPVYKGNDHYSVALQQGRVDASASFLPRIWLKQKKGVHAWYDRVPYFPSGAMPVL